MSKNWHGICNKRIGLRYQIYSLFSRGLTERESSLFLYFFLPETFGGTCVRTVAFFFKNRMFLLRCIVNMCRRHTGLAPMCFFSVFRGEYGENAVLRRNVVSRTGLFFCRWYAGNGDVMLLLSVIRMCQMTVNRVNYMSFDMSMTCN